MAAASHNIPPEPEVFGYYFQIPVKAEVKRVPVSMLSPSIQQRITRLGGSTETPYVVVVSPIIMKKFPSNLNERKTLAKADAKQVTSSKKSHGSDRRSETRTTKEQKSYLVPVKCFKDIALAILQLSQTYNQDTLSIKSEFRALSDSLNVNQQAVIKMEAAALYMCKNVMYLLPEGKKAEGRDEKCKVREKVVKSEVTSSQLKALNFKFEELKQEIAPKNSQLKMEDLCRNSEGRHDDLGCVSLRRSSFLQRQSRTSESRATVVKLWTEDLSPSKEIPSTTSTPKDKQQISFWEQSGRSSKRKLFSIGNEETSIKKICQNCFDPKSVPSSSPSRPHSSSSEASSPLDPTKSPPLFSDANSPIFTGFSSSSPRSSPAPQEAHPTYGDYTSPPHLEAKSSPVESIMSSGPRDTTSLNDTLPISKYLGSHRTSLLDIDDTTREEKTQKLLARVRECNKVIDDMRSEGVSEIRAEHKGQRPGLWGDPSGTSNRALEEEQEILKEGMEGSQGRAEELPQD